MKCAPVFAALLARVSEPLAVRINALVALADICARYAASPRDTEPVSCVIIRKNVEEPHRFIGFRLKILLVFTIKKKTDGTRRFAGESVGPGIGGSRSSTGTASHRMLGAGPVLSPLEDGETGSY